MNGSRQVPPAVIAMAVLVAATAFVVASRSPAFHTLPFIAPDAASYLNGDVGRTPAYPLLLRILPLAWLGAMQLAALAATAAWLAVSLAMLMPPVVAIGVECAILGNAALVAYAFTVLPEALFISAEQAQMALAIRLFRSPTRASGLSFGVVTASMVLLKPSGYSFLVPGCVLLWLLRRRGSVVAVPVLASIAGVLLSASTVNFVRTGVFGTQAYGGYALVGYVAHLLDERTPTAYPDLAATLVERTARTREELRRINAPDLYYMASSNAYHDVLDTAHPTILEYIRRRNPDIGDRDAFVRLNAIAQSLSLSAIARRPGGYAWHAGTHLYGLWSMPLIRNRADEDQFRARLAELTRIAPYTLRNPIVYRIVPPVVYWPIKGALFGAFIASILGLAYAVRGTEDAMSALLAYAAVSAHANFVLVSAVQTGLPRYALAMWPTMMVLAAAGGVMAAEVIRRAGRGTRRHGDPSAE